MDAGLIGEELALPKGDHAAYVIRPFAFPNRNAIAYRRLAFRRKPPTLFLASHLVETRYRSGSDARVQ
jgi:hypothetical protein